MRLRRWGGVAGLLLALTAAGAVRGARAGRSGSAPGTAVPTDGLSGAGGTAPAPDRPPTTTGPVALRERAGAWAELLRVSALFTVPGDALAGAAAMGRRPNRGTALAVGASLCLYEAGMALNDWADREEDAVDRPHRPIPSGRITPGAALAAAGALTAAGLTLASRAGRRPFAVASALAATVWSYDLYLKHTQAGPAAMAAARSLDILLGAAATATATLAASAAAPAAPRRPGGRAHLYSAHGPTAIDFAPGTGRSLGTSTSTSTSTSTHAPPGTERGAGTGRSLGASTRPSTSTRTHAGSGPGRGTGTGTRAAAPALRAALPAALLLGAHTYAVTAVSRHEAQGGSTVAPLAALAATVALGAAVASEKRGSGGLPPASGRGGSGEYLRRTAGAPARLLLTAFAGAYLRTAARPQLHAALNPSPPLTQRAVGGGIRAMIPLQAALATRAGAPVSGLVLMGLVPLARKLARKVSPT
ncbi:UbiA family prenyltransferase [Streptomyces sp. NPDC055749]